MFSLQLWTDLDIVGVVDLAVDVGDLFGRHVVRRDRLAEEADADLALDVAEAHVVLGTDANLKRRREKLKEISSETRQCIESSWRSWFLLVNFVYSKLDAVKNYIGLDFKLYFYY